MAITIQDDQEALVPVAVLDNDGEPLTIADGWIIQPASDNTEIATVVASTEITGVLIKSVGDAETNIGQANVTGTITLADGTVLDLGTLLVDVIASAPTGAGFSETEATVRPRT